MAHPSPARRGTVRATARLARAGCLFLNIWDCPMAYRCEQITLRGDGSVRWRAITCAGAAITVILTSSCNSRRRADSQAAAPATSERSRDPGAYPTNLLSFEIMRRPEVKLAKFQEWITSKGNRCQQVTEADLKGGFEGTDLWRVECSDSGEWLVTFLPGSSVSADSCVEDPANCDAAWKSVSRGSPV